MTGAFVEGRIAAEAAADYAAGRPLPAATASQWQLIMDRVGQLRVAPTAALLFSTDELEEAMQQVMDEYAGGMATAYRYTEQQLRLGQKHILRLTRLSESLRARDAYDLLKLFELQERLLICRVLIEHMLARRETRWHSFAENMDHPGCSHDFEKYVNSRLEQGEVRIIFRDLVKRGEHYEHQH